MNQQDLLNRMMHRDTNAFLELTEKYSWPVYSAVRARTEDSKQADRLFHQIMDGFYRSLHESKADDPLEALLLMYTEKVLQENGCTAAPARHDATQGKNGKTGGFLHNLTVLVLLASIAAVLWVIAGLLMDMNLLPGFDLGYSWFNANIIQWF